MNAEARKYSVIVTSVHCVDGSDTATGQAKYTGDVAISGMVEGKFLRSPHAHARIRSVEVAAAEAMPGVVSVLTTKNFTDICPYIGRGQNKDQPII
jgi:CO/xanthine dehydrogenase Mo-binding subunit